MPIADFNEYVSLLGRNQAADFQMSLAVQSGSMGAFYRNFLPTPATPTTSVALNKTSDSAIGPIPDSSTGNLCVLGGRFNVSNLAGVSLTVVDLLNQSGGLNGTITTEQTTNLPTAALTRYTSGEGVMVGLAIYSNVGNTGTTVTIRYTNQNGTSNRVSTATAFGSAVRQAGRLILIPLAAGDTGVQSVQGVTLTGTTGTAGDFGVVMFKPLTVFALESTSGAMPIDAVTGGMVGALQPFSDNACLSVIGISPVAQTISGAILLSEV